MAKPTNDAAKKCTCTCVTWMLRHKQGHEGAFAIDHDQTDQSEVKACANVGMNQNLNKDGAFAVII